MNIFNKAVFPKILLLILNYFPKPTILDKIFGRKWGNPVKLGRKRKIWYLFSCVF